MSASKTRRIPAGGTAAFLLAMAGLLTACGGGGSYSSSSSSSSSSSGGGGTPQLPDPATAPPLKTTIAGRFGVANYPVGAAIEPASITNPTESALLIKHFSSITAENVMKPDALWPSFPGTSQPTASPNFSQADLLVNFAQVNNLQLRGHTLLWHRTIPSWMLEGPVSQPVNYRAAIQQNLRNYIFAVIQHFPNVYAWDVVNEVASDTQNATNPYRTDSPWYQAYSVGGLDGSDYVRDAFTFANQARTSIGKTSATMKLLLNDYNTELPGKRANVIQIVRDLVNGGFAIDGVGHQFHLQLDANVADVTAAFTAVEAVSSTLVNHVTELDVSIYIDPGTCFSQRVIPPCAADYGASPPQSVLSQQALLYRALFNAFNRPSVTSVSLWGLADNHTWLHTFPVTRTNRPLLFDTAGLPKWAFWTVVDPSFQVP
jgi:endo-1,4-beta-xylanase